MLNTAVQVAEEVAEHAAGVHPVVLGVLAFGGLVALLVTTYAFRNAHNKH